MNYIDKIKPKFEQLSASDHGNQAHRQHQQTTNPPQTMPPSQSNPPVAAGPGGFYMPPAQQYNYNGQSYHPTGGSGYPPMTQSSHPSTSGSGQYPPANQQEGVPPKPPRLFTEENNVANKQHHEQRGLGSSIGGLSDSNVPPGVPLPLDQHDINPTTADGSKKHVSSHQDGGSAEGAMLFLNVNENELVHQRFLIIYGQVPGIKGANDRIVIHHPYFPPLTFPAADGYFKVLAELENGDNGLRFEYLQGDHCVRKGTLTIRMAPYTDKPPLLLAVIVGKDSTGEFDAPPHLRGPGRNDLDAAVRKFRCCAYLWQAFMSEQLYRQGFGRRTFNLEEYYEPDTMARDNMRRMTARVHVIRSKRTVAEIQDKERAQQWRAPPGYKRHTEESQFSLANEAINEYGVFKGPHYIACLSVDSRWDPDLGVILGHAALGGGVGERRIGVFGSHTTYSWPANAEEIPEKFLDTTKTDTRYLANDCNECGEYWRAANIGMGAFLHECGHLLTLAHTQSGIMSRGFNDYNRTFMVRAPNFEGPVRQRDEAGAHWHRTDIVRLRHHPCLRLPNDPPLRDSEKTESGFDTLATEDGILLRNENGITMIEVWVNDRYRSHLEYTVENLLRRRNGSIPAGRDEMAAEFPQEILLNNAKIHGFAGTWSDSDKVNLVLTSRSTSTETIEDFQALSKNSSYQDRDGNSVFKSGMLGKGQMKGSVKADAWFAAKQIRSSAPRLRSIEIRSGNYIDGIVLHMDDGSHVQIGKCQGGGRTMMPIDSDDDLDHIIVNCGWWIDGFEFVTARGRRSGWKGGRGGGRHVLRPPMGYGWMGLSGSGGDWLDSLTMHYSKFT
ncbi:hypothetical protein COEREDRAFT_79662 [Coemansia reversa NRRL 1564]|uniref:Jacalin-type lectin domain-containing protein n=1 Tax=Coemansia reversa (strain ATCC 12441 / NRRL 1564) TaxID=763665 RepID=A0A2G5BI13_COERN|nr:hypothetical protein COEREDRAFT_79662 [Coemansia reversa NRRL 1564]|eukprot:PIA18643.1 hypothetical protein COEREDRAFT_79662 [Coemansia reversa NRRL 1564]